MFNLIKKIRSRLKNTRNFILEHLGIGWYAQPAFNGMDKKLAKYLPSKGIFVEAGAHDGISQSNTYYLEKIKGWKGILVEPVEGNFKACVKNRPNSKVYNCALVSFECREKNLKMSYLGLMSFVSEIFPNEQEKNNKVAQLEKYEKSFEFEVQARTLNSLVEDSGFTKIDFLSLDVEGYELEVLKGLDFDKYLPTFMLIECRNDSDKNAIEQYLGSKYTFVEQLSHRDYLYKNVI